MPLAFISTMVSHCQYAVERALHLAFISITESCRKIRRVVERAVERHCDISVSFSPFNV